MRADRLLSILMLLQVRQRVTARELAERLEVSERTIYRDMDALSMAGVPVSAERGIGGGWSLVEGYRTNLTGLKETEIEALFLSQSERVLNDLGLRKASEAALIKLLASLPSMQRHSAEHARQRIHIDASGWQRQDESVACLPLLQEAIWQDQQVELAYTRSDGASVQRLVEPLGLVAKGAVWYLIAGVDGDLRTYRVSRIQDVRLTGQYFRRPDDFDLAAYWQESTEEFMARLPRYPATLRVQADTLPKLRWWRYAQAHPAESADQDGWVEVQVDFETEDSAAIYVLGFGAEVEVIAPDALREQVIQRAKAVLALYAEPG